MVYTHSSCNLAASASMDPHGGLFRLRRPNDIQPGVVNLEISGSKAKKFWIFDEHYFDRHVSNQPLHKRGWVVQERLLAPRVLYFSEYQILWECFAEQKCEGFPHSIPLHRSLKNFKALFKGLDKETAETQIDWISTFTLWHNIIEHYSGCALTKPGDKLVAISGLAKVFKHFTGDEYVAGLWRSLTFEKI